MGATYSWGVIQARLAADNLGPNSTLAFIGSISASWIALGAIVSGRLIRLVGSRNAGLLACFLLGLGQVLSGFSTGSVGGLFVTNGIVTGVGTCLGFMVSSIRCRCLKSLPTFASFARPCLRNTFKRSVVQRQDLSSLAQEV